jgi:hypothetical protein
MLESEEAKEMTRTSKIAGVAIASALLLGGFAFGRISETPKTTAAEDNKAALSQPSPLTTEAAKEAQQFYLSDFKTGYTDGYTAGLTSEPTSVVTTNRTGYNDGYKEGYTDGFKARVNPPQQTVVTSVARPARVVQREVVYRSAPAARKRNSTLKTVLTIAAPAAIGAGVGGAVGGGKGAGVGALIGGGGGALYTLIKNRDQ